MKKIYAIYKDYYAKSRPILLFYILLSFVCEGFFIMMPLVFAWLIDSAVYPEKRANFEVLLVITICMSSLCMVFISLQYYIKGKIEVDATAPLKEKIIQKLPTIQHEVLKKTTIGHVLQLVGEDIETTESLVIYDILKFILQVIFFIVVLAIVWHIHYGVFLVLVCVIPPLAIISRLMIPKITELREQCINKTEEVKDLANEMFGGSLIIKMANAYAFIDSKIAGIIAEYREIKLRYLKRDIIYDYLLIAGFLNMGNAAITIVGVFLIIKGSITVGAFTVLGIYFSHSWDSFEFFMGFYRNWKEKMVSVDRISNFLALPTEASEGRIADEFSSLQMSGISYDIDGVNILSNVSFEVNKGDRVLITGDNGSGKSTLVRLLVGLMSPSSGSIIYNGCDITNYNLHSLRERVSYIPAEPYIFSGGLADNFFCRGGHDRPFQVPIDPEKYAVIAKEGSNLSSGEKKRLQLASGMLQDSDIYILDEPLNFVDEASKREIVETIKNEFNGKTLIVISHEALPFEFCECRYVMSEGKVVSGKW